MKIMSNSTGESSVSGFQESPRDWDLRFEIRLVDGRGFLVDSFRNFSISQRWAWLALISDRNPSFTAQLVYDGQVIGVKRPGRSFSTS